MFIFIFVLKYISNNKVFQGVNLISVFLSFKNHVGLHSGKITASIKDLQLSSVKSACLSDFSLTSDALLVSLCWSGKRRHSLCLWSQRDANPEPIAPPDLIWSDRDEIELELALALWSRHSSESQAWCAWDVNPPLPFPKWQITLTQPASGSTVRPPARLTFSSAILSIKAAIWSW